jgi:hypothetical protein
LAERWHVDRHLVMVCQDFRPIVMISAHTLTILEPHNRPELQLSDTASIRAIRLNRTQCLSWNPGLIMGSKAPSDQALETLMLRLDLGLRLRSTPTKEAALGRVEEFPTDYGPPKTSIDLLSGIECLWISRSTDRSEHDCEASRQNSSDDKSPQKGAPKTFTRSGKRQGLCGLLPSLLFSRRPKCRKRLALRASQRRCPCFLKQNSLRDNIELMKPIDSPGVSGRITAVVPRS